MSRHVQGIDRFGPRRGLSKAQAARCANDLLMPKRQKRTRCWVSRSCILTTFLATQYELRSLKATKNGNPSNDDASALKLMGGRRRNEGGRGAPWRMSGVVVAGYYAIHREGQFQSSSAVCLSAFAMLSKCDTLPLRLDRCVNHPSESSQCCTARPSAKSPHVHREASSPALFRLRTRFVGSCDCRIGFSTGADNTTRQTSSAR